MQLHLNAAPKVSITPAPTATFCLGDSIMLSSAPAANYIWNTQATTQSIYIKKQGTYILTITDSNGCKASDSVQATMIPTPNASFAFQYLTPNSTMQFSANNTHYMIYDWQFGDGTTGSGKVVQHSYTMVGQDTVTLTVTDSMGCTSNNSEIITLLSVDKPDNYFSLSIAPNPYALYTTLQYHLNNSDMVLLKLTDLSGKCILGPTQLAKQAGTQSLDLHTPTPGIYILQITINSITKTYKLVHLNDGL
jgi:PKD repeat protein